MWMAKNNNVGPKEGGGTNGVVAVAIDKDKSSQHALKWAVDHLLQRGQSVILVHVKLRPSPLTNSPSLHASSASKQTLLLLLPPLLWGISQWDIENMANPLIVCFLCFFRFLMVCVYVSELSQDTSLVCRDPEGASKELFLPFRCFCTRKDVSFSV